MDSLYDTGDWIRQREFDPVKLPLIPAIQKILEVINKVPDIAFQTDPVEKPYLCAEGNPILDLIKVYPPSHFRFLHTPVKLWKEFDAEESLVEWYQSKGLLKYSNKGIEVEEEYPVVVFLPSYAREREVSLIHQLCFQASTLKRRILFKKHPAKNLGIESIFKSWNSPYIIVTETMDTTALVRQAELVLSMPSSVSLIALLEGKRVGSFIPFDLSEIVPTITITNFWETPRLSRRDILKFCLWYKQCYCIDIDQDNVLERLLYRVTHGYKPLTELYRLEKNLYQTK